MTISPVRLDEYQLRLPSFEGPLDVLLNLIERERLDISELSLVAVTDGFLAYIEGLEDPPAALLAEFAGIAARLLVLKSRALLPKPPAEEEEPDVDDLAEQLRQYQRAKAAARHLRAIEALGHRTFARPPTTTIVVPRIILVPPPIAHLQRALLRTLARVRVEPEVAPLRRIVSIGEMVDRLRGRLRPAGGTRRFREIVGSQHRDELTVGFIALLALWRRGEVEVIQDSLFGDIHVQSSAIVAGSMDD